MKNWKIWTAFAAVFAAGIIVGIVGVGIVIQAHFAKPKNPDEFHARVKVRVMERFMDEVKPNASAIPAVEAILDETITELEAIRKETGPRVKAVFEKSKERIKVHLSPEQKERFETMTENMRKRRFGFLKLPPPPPPIP